MRCFVVGNVAVDEIFAVDALPEKGASIFGRQVARDLGGKGANQAVVLARAGLPTLLIAGIGVDERGDWIARQLAEEGLERHRHPRFEGASDVSIVLTTSDGDNAIVTTTAAAESLELAAVEAALGIASAGDLLLQQGNLSVDVTRAVFTAAKRRNMLTAFNPSPVKSGFATLWALADIVVLNESEAMALTGSMDETAARRILAAGSAQVVLTLGEKGAILADANGIHHVPAVPANVVETTGAGDTFMGAALASALRRERFLDRRAIEAAARAAALTVGRRGTRQAFPSREEMARILAR